MWVKFSTEVWSLLKNGVIAKYDSVYDHKLLHRTLSDEVARIVSASSKSQTFTNFQTADLSKSIFYGFQKLKKYQKSKNDRAYMLRTKDYVDDYDKIK